MAHSGTVLTAARLSGVPIRIRIAAGVSSPLARRDRRGVLILRSAGLIQFRSAAVGAASQIASAILGGIARLGARVERVFVSMKEVVLSLIHEPNVDRGAERDAPQFEAPGA